MLNNFLGRRLFRNGTMLPLIALVALSACEDAGGAFDFLKPKPGSEEAAETDASTTTKLVERDVEAPEVFQVTDSGLWDGRPSLGGVWVAHPDVNEPERVIIRNTQNSKFVIGALFRRERQNPGPVIQVSSDAAAALGMLAGAPAELNVTALHREAAPVEEPADAPTEELDAPDDIEATALDPVAGAAAAIDEVEAEAEAEAVSEPLSAINVPTPASQPERQDSTVEKPYIQIGIFNFEQNARDTANSLRKNGIVPIVKEQSSQGKKFWRVIVGPASTSAERSILLKQIKSAGFDDAYTVTN